MSLVQTTVRCLSSGLQFQRFFPTLVEFDVLNLIDFYSSRYEDVVFDLHNQTSRIYDFVNQTQPLQVVDQLKKMANVGRKNRTATEIAVRWRNKLSRYEKNVIEDRCRSLIQTLSSQRGFLK